MNPTSGEENQISNSNSNSDQRPEGFDNWTLDKKQEFNKLKERLSQVGVNIEIVDSQMNQAMYYDVEKILRIRRDVNDVQYLNGYVENTVFQTQDGVDELPDPGELEDIHTGNEGEDTNDSEGEGDNRINGEVPVGSKEEKLTGWNEINNLLGKLGIGLDEINDEEDKKFEEKNPGKFDERVRGISRTIESFANKNKLKEKVGKIKLIYPRYKNDEPIFLSRNVLTIDLDCPEVWITNFLNRLDFGNKSAADPKEMPSEPKVEELGHKEEGKLTPSNLDLSNPAEQPAPSEKNRVVELTAILEAKGFYVYRHFREEEKNEWIRATEKCIRALEMSGINSVAEAGFESISPRTSIWPIHLIKTDSSTTLNVPSNADVDLLSQFMKYAPSHVDDLNRQVSLEDFLADNTSFVPKEFENNKGLIIKIGDNISWQRDGLSGQGVVKGLFFRSGLSYVVVDGSDVEINDNYVTAVNENGNKSEIAPIAEQKEEQPDPATASNPKAPSAEPVTPVNPAGEGASNLEKNPQDPKVGDTVSFETIKSGLIIQGVIKEILDSGKLIVQDVLDGREYNIFPNQIKGILKVAEVAEEIPSGQKEGSNEQAPDEEDDTSSEIKEVIGKNGETIRIGDTVEWDRRSGRKSGRVVSIELTRGNYLRAVVDMGEGVTVKIFADELSLVNNESQPEPAVASNPSPSPRATAPSAEPTTPQNPEPVSSLPGNTPLQKAPFYEKWGMTKEEWEQFENYRVFKAESEIERNKAHGIISGRKYDEEKRKETVKNFESDKNYYDNRRYFIAQKIEESLRRDAGGNLTSEQEAELKSKINDEIFEHLVKKENDAYLSVLREMRSKTPLGKAWEGAKSLLNTRAAQWYLGLSKTQRIGVSLGIAGLVSFVAGGTVVGALGVGGYLGKRAFSIGAGVGMGELVNKKKSWSLEEINKLEQAEIEELKNSDLSLEDKSKKEFDIRNKYKGARLKATLWKAGLTAVAGGGTSLLANLAEGAFGGVGGGARPTAEGRVSKASGAGQDRIPPRQGYFTRGKEIFEKNVTSNLRGLKPLQDFPPSKAPIVVPTEKVLKEIGGKIYEENSPDVTEPPEKPDASTPPPKSPQTPPGSTEPPKPPETPPGKAVELSASEKQALKEIFPKDPNVVNYEVVKGDSTWKSLEKVLDNNERFRNLGGTGTPQEIADQIEAKRTRVLQAFTAEILKNHEQYGVGTNGEVEIGQKLDLSKLFADKERFDEILKDAENLKSAQVSSIVANNNKIEDWIRENRGKPVDVDEILSPKPKLEVVPEEPAGAPEGETAEEQIIKGPEAEEAREAEYPAPERPEVSASEASVNDNFLGKKPAEPADLNPSSPKVEPPKAEDGVMSSGREGVYELEVAKKRLEALEGGKSNEPANQTAAQGVEGREGLRTMQGDISGNVELAFRAEVNKIYGERGGFLWTRRIAGVDTEEWRKMARLPATEVVKYYTDNSTKSNLSMETIKMLAESKKHQAFINQTLGLMDRSGLAIKPLSNENMESFVKRLGGYVYRISSQNLKKAA